MIQHTKVDEENGDLYRIMVYKPTGEVGIVDRAEESRPGWTTKIRIKLKNGETREGNLSQFEDAIGEKRSKYLYD